MNNLKTATSDVVCIPIPRALDRQTSDLATLAHRYGDHIEADTRQHFEQDEEQRRITERCHELFENAKDVIYVHDLNGRYLAVNKAAANLVGYTCEEILRKRISDVVAPEYMKEIRRRMNQKLRNTEQTTYEVEVITKSGRRVPVEVSSRLIHEKGVPVAVQGIARDITDRKRDEQALKESEERYRALFENANDIIFTCDRAGTFTSLNRAGEKLTGYSRAEASTMNFAQVVAPEFLSLAREMFARKAEDDVVTVYDLEIITKSGNRAALEVSSRALLSAGQRVGIQGIARDITGRKQAEARLTESERRLRAILDSEPECVKLLAADSTLLEMNRAGLAMIEAEDFEQLAGKCVLGIVDPAYRTPFQELTNLVFRGGSGTLEFEITGLKGAHRWLETNAVPLRDDNGAVSAVLSVTRDITERKRLERERQALFEIIQGVSTTANLEGLLELIHRSIGTVLYAENCFIALCDENDDASLSLQFFVDKHDAIPPPQTLGKSCAAHVLRTGRPLLINQEIFDGMVAAGDAELVGKPSPSWLGVPLNTPSKTIGVLVVQHYEDEQAYSKHDLEFLASVGGQIAVAIERKKAEGALRQSEERYRDLVENARDIIYTHDLQGNFTSSNKAAEEITGYTSEEALKLNFGQLVTPEHHGKLNEMIKRMVGAEDIAAEELEIFAKDGRRIPLEVTTRVVVEDGVPVGIMGVARDIRERRAAETELRRLAAAVDATADSIVVTDTSGNIQYVNPAFERITGYSEAEALGQNPRVLKSGKTDDAVYRDLWETITSGKVWTGQLTNKKKDGTLFEEHVTISPVRDGVGKIVNYIAVKQDITLQTQLEQQLQGAQRLEAIGQLAGGVAHDFNNLLTAILGYSDLTLAKLNPNDHAARNLREIKKAGERAAALTRQLLAFSRKQILEPQVLDLNAVIVDINKMLRRLIGEDVELITQCAADLGTVKADLTQIEQVIMNLVVNARDAMPGGGKLIIETQNVALDADYRTRLQTVQTGNYVRLAVTDTGCGMDEETQARIFEPFFTTKEFGKGTGLGLSTIYGIVKQSGGYIWVYSELGKGTTFKVYLPRADESVPITRAQDETPAIEKGNGTVLLVEDDDSVRGITAQFLESAGYTVLKAAGGPEALEIVKQHADDIRLIITDVVMPEMSGRELSERLAVLLPKAPVLFISGYTDDAIVRAGIVGKNLAFLEKPFTPQILARKVGQILGAADSNKLKTD